jgi:hypothetical protein
MLRRVVLTRATRRNIPEDTILHITLKPAGDLQKESICKAILVRGHEAYRVWDVEVPTSSRQLTDDGCVVSLTRRPRFTPQEDS